ncbi:DPH4 homolog [Scaptodrosophila lebanonensis]|uniref:DPH4 homolog n=1 Tax=Drosophila lebanonensis TaxID=7225 RepID=A0A6J2TEX3_DROLE|nr:DPH4 homolog [Scaptodrosophila lebanonensis]XP_030373658.1 DPH4 homolog [Scaptodrosophila lebanonensis]
MRNFYELLNAPATATFDELKRNYKNLILQCHPDKLQQHGQKEERVSTAPSIAVNTSDPNLESSISSLSNFNAINEAWNTLKDPIKRKHYDAELLQSKFQTHSNIYATITLSDMRRAEVEMEEVEGEEEQPEADADKETVSATTMGFAFTYNCRCGGQYVLDEAAAGALDESPSSSAAVATLKADADASDNDDKTADKPASEVIVECNECSLVIIVERKK